MSNIPKNLRWEEVANALRKLGFKQVKRSGSHALYTNKDHRMVTLITRNPVKRGTLQGIIDQAGSSVEDFLALL